MRVVVAPSAFRGTLTAVEAASAIAAGWSRAAPGDEIVQVPMSDGRIGFLDAVAGGLRRGGVPVAGTGAVLICDRTAWIEAARSCPPVRPAGPQLGSVRLGLVSSAPVGQAVLAALAEEVRRVVVGVGDVGCHDAGAGMLHALGVGRSVLAGGGEALTHVTSADLAGLAQCRARFAGIDLVAAVSEHLPLLGLAGTSAVTAADRGATAEQAQQLESALGTFAAAATDALGPVGADLLSRSATPERSPTEHSHQTGRSRLTSVPGAGAGGGLGFGLGLLGARVLPGAEVVAEAVRLDEAVAAADLVITGEGTMDWRSLRDSVVTTVAAAGLRTGVPVVVIAGRLEVGRRESTAIGVETAYAVAETGPELAAALADPVAALQRRSERVARTWSHYCPPPHHYPP